MQIMLGSVCKSRDISEQNLRSQQPPLPESRSGLKIGYSVRGEDSHMKAEVIEGGQMGGAVLMTIPCGVIS